MGIKWGDAPFNTFSIHNIAYNEGGYNYYLYIHAVGYAVSMREKLDETEYLYADASQSGKNWANRASLEYSTYDKLVE